MSEDVGLAREDRSTTGGLLPAVLAGLVAAIAGGIVWGLIVKWTEYEVGFAAWGIGLLVALAVLTASGGRKGIPFQAVAIVFALLGIVLGKYLSFVWVLQDVAGEVTGGAVDVPLFSTDTVDLFIEELGTVFGWIDLLWVAFAVFTAWRTLQPEEPEQEPAPAPGGPPAA